MADQGSFLIKTFFQSPKSGLFYVKKFPLDLNKPGDSPDLFSQLVTLVAAAFSDHLDHLAPDDLIITWRDCDGDYVTMSTNLELQDALNEAESHKLKIYVTAKLALPHTVAAEQNGEDWESEFYPSTDNRKDEESQAVDEAPSAEDHEENQSTNYGVFRKTTGHFPSHASRSQSHMADPSFALQTDFPRHSGISEMEQDNLYYPTERTQYITGNKDCEEKKEEKESREAMDLEEIKAAVPFELRSWAKDYIKCWLNEGRGDLSVLLDGIDASSSDDDEGEEDENNDEEYIQEKKAMKLFRAWLNKFLLHWHTGFMVNTHAGGVSMMDEDESSDVIPEAFKRWAYAYMEQRENVTAECNTLQQEFSYFGGPEGYDAHDDEYFAADVPSTLSYPMAPYLPPTVTTTSSLTQTFEAPTQDNAGCIYSSSVSPAIVNQSTMSSASMTFHTNPACTTETITATERSNDARMNYPNTSAGLTFDTHSVTVADHQKLVYPPESASIVSSSSPSLAANSKLSNQMTITSSTGSVSNAIFSTSCTPSITPLNINLSYATTSYTLAYPTASMSVTSNVTSIMTTTANSVLKYPAVSTTIPSPYLAVASSTSPKMVYPHNTTSTTSVEVASTSAPFLSYQAVMTSATTPATAGLKDVTTTPNALVTATLSKTTGMSLTATSIPVASGLDYCTTSPNVLTSKSAATSTAASAHLSKATSNCGLRDSLAHLPTTATSGNWNTTSLPMSTSATYVPRTSTVASAPLLLTASAHGLRMSTVTMPVTTSPASAATVSTGLTTASQPLTSGELTTSTSSAASNLITTTAAISTAPTTRITSTPIPMTTYAGRLTSKFTTPTPTTSVTATAFTAPLSTANMTTSPSAMVSTSMVLTTAAATMVSAPINPTTATNSTKPNTLFGLIQLPYIPVSPTAPTTSAST